MTVDRGVVCGLLSHFPRAVITSHVSDKLLKPLSALDFRLGGLYLLIVHDGVGQWHITDCGLTYNRIDKNGVMELASKGICLGEQNELCLITRDYDFINDIQKMVNELGRYYENV